MINSALANGVMALEAGATAVSLDFSDALTSSLNGISSDFAKYALVAVPIAIGIWAAPRVIRIVMRFFSSLTH
ncbi:MAG: hypothetical protein HDR04_06320 [Lachnospiraceae bacterium]|nr:hypothetical protein [Lachnospiraceae bacterium]